MSSKTDELTNDSAVDETDAEPVGTKDGSSAEDTSTAEADRDAGDGDDPKDTADTPAPKRFARFRFNVSWKQLLVYGVLPAVALMLALGAGRLKWYSDSASTDVTAGAQAVQVARDSTVALLSYRPDTAERDLGAAQNLLTGSFRDSYTSLTHDVVIPGAKQRQVTAVATVPAAALVSATGQHAIVLVAVNQTVTVGSGAPSDTASSVRVTLDRVGNHWLISGFDPV